MTVRALQTGKGTSERSEQHAAAVTCTTASLGLGLGPVLLGSVPSVTRQHSVRTSKSITAAVVPMMASSSHLPSTR